MSWESPRFAWLVGLRARGACLLPGSSPAICHLTHTFNFVPQPPPTSRADPPDISALRIEYTHIQLRSGQAPIRTGLTPFGMAEVSLAFSPQSFDFKNYPPCVAEAPSASDLSTTSSDDYIKSEPSPKAARLEATSNFNWESSQHFDFSKPAGWSPEDSKQLYNLPGWGAPYFNVNDSGNLVVCPAGGAAVHKLRAPQLTSRDSHWAGPAADDGRGVDVYKLVQSLADQGLRTPCLLRFLDIVGDRIERLNVRAGAQLAFIRAAVPVITTIFGQADLLPAASAPGLTGTTAQFREFVLPAGCFQCCDCALRVPGTAAQQSRMWPSCVCLLLGILQAPCLWPLSASPRAAGQTAITTPISTAGPLQWRLPCQVQP
jgi:hypothetical protein